MNAAETVKRLLVYTDHRTLAEANTAGTEYLEAAVDAINAAAQQIYLTGPETISKRDYGLAIRPAATISATLTSNSATATLTGSASWMQGCAFSSEGLPYNRIMELSGGTATLQNQIAESLTLPTSLIVYHDALVLPDEVTHVLPGLTLDDSITLRAATIEADLYNDNVYSDNNDYGEEFLNLVQARPPVPGRPRAYMVTPIATTGNASQNTNYIRLCPYPTNAGTVRFSARVRPPRVAVSDLDAANNGAACTREISLPSGWDELFLLPIAKQFYSASPFFNNNNVREEFGRAYLSALEQLTLTRAQRSRTAKFIPTI